MKVRVCPALVSRIRSSSPNSRGGASPLAAVLLPPQRSVFSVVRLRSRAPFVPANFGETSPKAWRRRGAPCDAGGAPGTLATHLGLGTLVPSVPAGLLSCTAPPREPLAHPQGTNAAP